VGILERGWLDIKRCSEEGEMRLDAEASSPLRAGIETRC
jgi:hypothetical protein